MSPHSVEQGPLVAALIPRDTRVKKMFSLVPFAWSNSPTDHNSPTGQEGDAVVHSGLWQVGNGADIRRREELNGGQDVWVCVAAYDHLPCCKNCISIFRPRNHQPVGRNSLTGASAGP